MKGHIGIMVHNAMPAVTVFVSGDEFLNNRAVCEAVHQAQQILGQDEVVELDATQIDKYELLEATGPSLLAQGAIVVLRQATHMDESLYDVLATLLRDHVLDVKVIVQMLSAPSSKRRLDQLVGQGAQRVDIPEQKNEEAKVNLVYSCFEQRKRAIEQRAAQQLVAVFGSHIDQLSVLCEQLCDDYDTNPISLEIVNRYLTADPQVTVFNVSDYAMSGNISEALLAARSAVEQGIEPIAIIGACAAKLRTLAKVAAFENGELSSSQLGMPPWMVKQAKRQLPQWNSAGIAQCFMKLAHADEVSKTRGGDVMLALEDALAAIARRGK